jgi:protein-disulfide isomerase
MGRIAADAMGRIMFLAKRAAAAALGVLVLAVCPAEDIPSLLKPPPGAKTAVVLFQDLQWADCAAAYPSVQEAAKAHNVPLVIHDFPLPRHEWSFAAAVNARFFDSKSQQLGNDFRGYILQNQKQITDHAVLQRYTQNFASSHQIQVPAAIDPEGKLADSVRADFLLGQRIGVEHTPTLFVVSQRAVSPAQVGSIPRERLNKLIEQMQKTAEKERPPEAIQKQGRK